MKKLDEEKAEPVKNCMCSDCKEQRLKKEVVEQRKNENIQRHLDHPFYRRVDEVTDEVAVGQILKGAGKYEEPFNPASWTNKELVMHQLQELRDAQVYGVGLLDRLDKQEAEIEELRKYKASTLETLIAFSDVVIKVKAERNELKKDLELAKIEAEHWRLRSIKADSEREVFKIERV